MREALSKLQSSKLVELIPNKGYQITNILDDTSMKSLAEFRFLIESSAIKTIIRNNKVDCLPKLIEINEQIKQIKNGGSYKEILMINNLDSMFHLLLVESMRIESWIQEAVQQGAKVIAGGKRKGIQFEPTILVDVLQSMKVVCEEIFGPVITVQKYSNLDEVIIKANDSSMGLQVGIFTSNMQKILKSIKKMKFGGVIINNVSTYREAVMPYGGEK